VKIIDYQIICEDSLRYLSNLYDIHLTFLDPPFNQGKDYTYFDDKKSSEVYWNWVEAIVQLIYNATAEGGAIYFMQREKNTQVWDEFSKWLNKEHDELTLSEYAMKIVEYNSKKEKKTAQKSEEIPALIPENEHRRDAKEDRHHAQHVRNVDGNCVYVH